MSHIPDNYQNGRPFSATPPGAVDFSHITAEDRFFTASDDQRVVELSESIRALAVRIDLLVPPGRNKSLALTQLEEVQMRANRGIFAPEGMR